MTTFEHEERDAPGRHRGRSARGLIDEVVIEALNTVAFLARADTIPAGGDRTPAPSATTMKAQPDASSAIPTTPAKPLASTVAVSRRGNPFAFALPASPPGAN